MTQRSDWCTIQEACEETGRSRATIYAWLNDADNGIRTAQPRKIRYLNRLDLMRVENQKRKSLGRPRKPRPGDTS